MERVSHFPVKSVSVQRVRSAPVVVLRAERAGKARTGPERRSVRRMVVGGNMVGVWVAWVVRLRYWR